MRESLLMGSPKEYSTLEIDIELRCIISVRIHTTLKTTESVFTYFSGRMKGDETPVLVPAVLCTCAVFVLLAISFFNHDFSDQETHCNSQFCIDLISISQVALGIVSIGNPVALGRIPIRFFDLFPTVETLKSILFRCYPHIRVRGYRNFAHVGLRSLFARPVSYPLT